MKQFGNAYNNKEFSDITLVSEDGKWIHAHKAILSGASPFFQRLISNSKESTLIFTEHSELELEILMELIYFGEIQTKLKLKNPKVDKQHLFSVLSWYIDLKGSIDPSVIKANKYEEILANYDNEVD